MAEITSSATSIPLTLDLRVRIFVEPPSIIGHATALGESVLQVRVGLDPAKFPSDNEAYQAGLTGQPLKDVDRGTLGQWNASPAIKSSEKMVESLLPKSKDKPLASEVLEKANAGEPIPVTAAAMEKDLSHFAEENLSGFPLDPAKANKIAAKAAEKAPQIAKTFQVAKAIIPKIAKLAYYDHKILCDDSGSMKGEKGSRIETLGACVRGIFRIGTSLSSNTDVSLVPFEGSAADGLKSEADVEAALKRIAYNTGATVPKPLQKRILNPLLEAAKAKQLRPTIVSVITDGDIGGIETFSDTIAGFKKKLNGYGYTGPAVVFLICRVGSDEAAATSLLQLKTNETIKDILLYSEDKLDGKLQEAGKDIDKFAGWVIGELIHALELQLH